MFILDINLIIGLLVSVFVGAAAGYLGSLMILKRMGLVGDALSHVALPGLALAFIFNFNPFLGAFTFLIIAVLIIWLIEQKTTLPIESVVGILFTVSLAIGILIIPQTELLEALFGSIAQVSLADAALTILFSIIIFIVIRAISNHTILSIISKDLAQTNGVNTAKNQLIFLMFVALIVALGIKVVGTLLMGALVIIPAAAAKNISSGFNHFLRLSAYLGAFSAFLGIILSKIFILPPGPTIILISALIFMITLIFKKT